VEPSTPSQGWDGVEAVDRTVPKGVKPTYPRPVRDWFTYAHPSRPRKGPSRRTAVRCTVRFWVRREMDQTAGLNGTRNGNLKAVGPDAKVVKVKWDSQSQPGARETHSR